MAIPHISERPPNGDRRARSLGRVVWLTVSALVGISVIPVVGFVVGTGLDPSWGLGFHMARAQHLAFGRDIAWPFGPFAFVLVPTMAYPSSGLAACWLRLPVFAGVAALVSRKFIALARVPHDSPNLGARVANGSAVGAAVLATVPTTWTLIGALGGSANIIVALYAMGAAFAVRALLTREAVSERALVVAAITCGLGALARFDTGVIGLGLALLVALQVRCSARSKLRSVAVVVGVFAATVVFGWVALGQPLGTFWGYLVTSFELGRGYGGGLAWSAHPSWTGPVVALCVLATLVCIGLSRAVRRPSVWAVIGCVGLAVTTAQQSLSRYDTGHIARAVCLCTALVVLFVCHRTIIVSALTLILCVLTMISLNDSASPYPQFGWPPRGEVPFVHPTTGLRYAWRTFDFTVSASKRNARITREHDRLGVLIGLPESVRAVIRGKSVHIEPWDCLWPGFMGGSGVRCRYLPPTKQTRHCWTA